MSEWDYKIFWDEAVSQFKEELSFPVFSMWFMPAKYEKSTENSVVLAVPSQFFRDQLITKHKKAIEKKLCELSGKKLSIEFTINKENSSNSEKTEAIAAISGPISIEKEAKKKQKPAKNEDNGRGQHPDLKSEYNFEDFVVVNIILRTLL